MRGNAKRWEAQLARKQAPFHRRHAGPRSKSEFTFTVWAMGCGAALVLFAIVAPFL